jgi:hypothetical protein
VIVVSDTSPISNLHQIGKLQILKHLHGEVIIPPAVERELRDAGTLHHDLDFTLLRVVVPLNGSKVTELLRVLDRGESEAIVLASEIGADLVLIDETTGRELAKQHGLRRTGLLGVLLESPRGRPASPAFAPLARSH